VATEYEDMVIDAWEVEEAAKAKKEADKRQALVLGLWKKFASGLKIIERMKAEYGEDVELPEKKAEPASKATTSQKTSEWEVFQNHTNFEGGFVRDTAGPSDGGFIREEIHEPAHNEDLAGGFFPASQDEPVHGDLTIEHGEQKEATRTSVADSAYRTPISLTATLQRPQSEASDQSAEKDDEAGNARDTEEEEEVTPKPSTTRRKSAALQFARGRARGRGVKSTTPSTRKRKSLVIDTSDEDSELSEAPSDPPAAPPSTRSAPKRTAARKSEAQVKSHFFADGSEGETDFTDMTDRASPKKRTATRGRGTGRGRGRSKAKS
jgi:xeroderma pigmentosum group C-complementing protein